MYISYAVRSPSSGAGTHVLGGFGYPKAAPSDVSVHTRTHEQVSGGMVREQTAPTRKNHSHHTLTLGPTSSRRSGRGSSTRLSPRRPRALLFWCNRRSRLGAGCVRLRGKQRSRENAGLLLRRLGQQRYSARSCLHGVSSCLHKQLDSPPPPPQRRAPSPFQRSTQRCMRAAERSLR